MSDLISRQEAIDALEDTKQSDPFDRYEKQNIGIEWAIDVLKTLPSAEPTLYGYKIEHLVYIAKVMEKEGVTADYAVRTFNDMSRVIKMIIDEIQKKVEETLDERFNQQTGCA